MEQPLLLKPSKVAELLGLGRSQVYRMLATGELPSVKLGSSVRVPVADFQRWLEARVRRAGGGDGN